MVRLVMLGPLEFPLRVPLRPLVLRLAATTVLLSVETRLLQASRIWTIGWAPVVFSGPPKVALAMAVEDGWVETLSWVALPAERAMVVVAFTEVRQPELNVSV